MVTRWRSLFFLGLVGSLSAVPAVFEVGPGRTLTTLDEARDAVRKKQAAGALAEGAVVRVFPGVYQLDDSFTLGSADSGKPGAPIRWEAAQPGTAQLQGGKALAHFQPVSDQAILARLPAVSRERVLVTPLSAEGIADAGEIAPRGNPGLELFFRGKRMPLSRFPNDGWQLIADVPQDGPTRFNEGLEREKRFNGVPAGRHYGRINYPGDEPAHWSAENEIYLHGYWTWDWSDSFQRVASIDPARHEITLAEPHHNYGYTRNQRFRYLNVLEELDQPGEWCLDRKKRLVYFLPPAAPGPGEVVASVLERPLIVLKDVSYVTLSGLMLENSRGSGITIEGGEGCLVAGCTLRNLGGEALTVDGGKGHVIQSCDLFELANGAIRLSGGDRATLTPAGHRASNNHIHHFSQWLRTGQYGILFEGVGQRIDHNLIHDAPFEALYLRGNDHVLEYNEIHDVTQETGDAGAIHTGRDWTWQGNVIRYNYWHDLKGPGLHGTTAVYLDDFSSGFTVHGNVFYRAGRGVQLGGGRDNVVTNNLFVECRPSVHLDARGLGWASNYFNGGYPWMFERFRELHADQPPYVTRYPRLKTIVQDEPAVPKGNRIEHNVSWGGRWIDLYDFFAYDFHGLVSMKDNWIADPDFVRRRAVAEKAWDPYFLDIDTVKGYRTWRSAEPETQREFAGNRITADAPGEFDPVTLTFTARNAAALKAMGYEELPVSQMGLQRDEWRHEIPVRVVGGHN